MILSIILPSLLPDRRSCRSSSPADRWRAPYSNANFSHWVPLPAPGPPDYDNDSNDNNDTDDDDDDDGDDT